MGAIANRDILLSHGMRELRAVALDLIEAGLEAIDPVRAVREVMTLDGVRLSVSGREYDLGTVRNVYVLGAGKASLRVAEGIESVLGDRITGGLVIVRGGQARPLKRIAVREADHPLPSERSWEAARQLIHFADSAGPADLVLACVTGGSSALACYPAEGVSLEEKRALHRLLLSCGANIEEINAVRKHVSRIKGGRLAAHIAPARIINLTVSDVAGDPPDYITDLTVQDSSTVADAIRVLHEYDLWDRVAPSIRNHLTAAERAESPVLRGLDIHTVMLVTGDTACAAMACRAEQAGFTPVILSTFLEGESREVGVVLASLLKECARKGRPFRPPCALLACGGETTVTLVGESAGFGSGGPNQEVALGASLKLDPTDRVAGVWLDTDGSDGGTEFAGAIADGLTRSRAIESHLDLKKALLSHQAGYALAKLEDLVVTGPTHTNVNDICAIVIV